MDLKHETFSFPNLQQENSEEKKNNISSSPKSCTDCCTTRTPLWRSGPHGPKTLCNACGIKYNKKRRERLGLEIGKKRKRSGGAGNWSSEVEEILKMRLVSFGSEVRSRKLMSKLREEEQAAILLMTLSCGSVYA